ncbi:hypothetical protein ACIGXM_19625 [Kitasatospora sp. NPDC052896]|uniref:hypothetical protein n=1 Tax=Kitasatospora sp. NPDC052896 TaxID=3364061 RepID=UPI0037C910B5
MPKQFQYRRRTAGLALATTLAAALSVTTLSACQGLPWQQKTLPEAQLKSELLTAPTGSKPFDRGTLAPGGVLTLDQFVDGMFVAQQQSSEKGDATRDGFKYAVETNWQAPDGTQADLFLIQFSGSGGAQDYVSSVSEGTSRGQTPAEPLSSLQGVPGGEALSAGAVDKAGNIQQSAWFAVGDIAADLHYYTPGAANPTGLDQLAKAQHARLTGNVTTPSPFPTSSATAPAPASAAPAPATPADQSRLVNDLVPLPSGAQPWRADSQDGPTGVLTPQQLIARIAEPSDQQRVTAEETDRGFQYAVRENWNASDGTQVDIDLLQFASATGAQSFVLAYQGGAGDAVGTSGTYAIPGSGDAMAFEHAGLDSDGDIRTEGYAVVGNIALDINVWTPAKADRAAATALIQQQYARVLADPTVAAVAKAAPALPTPTS